MRGINRTGSKAWRGLWAAALMTTTALGCVAWSAPVLAQSAEAFRDFDIPAQPLPSALTLFGRQSGLQVSVPAALAQGRTSGVVSGAMAPLQALSRLLEGTGLSYRISGNIVTLEPAPKAADNTIQLGPVRVEGQIGATSPAQTVIGNLPPPYVGGQVAAGSQLGLLGNKSVMDTPFNQTSYTQQTIQDQQATKLTDVFDNDPSVRASGSTSDGFESFFVRGFNVSSGDIGFNGLYGLGTQWTFTGLDSVERVELLKGPGTLLDGMPPFGDIGGSINLVTKRATDDPITQVTTTYASNSQFGTQVDVGRRYGDNNEFGIRFNGTFRDGDTAVDHQSEELGDASLGLDYRGDRLRVSIDLGYQNDSWEGNTRFVFTSGLNTIPAAPNATNNLSPPWSNNRLNSTLAMAQGEFDIADHLTAYASVGVTDSYLKFQDINGTITDPQGDFTSSVEVGDSQKRVNVAAQGGVRSSFDTGPIEHAVNVNVSTANQTYWANLGAFPQGTLAISSNIYNPVFPPQPSINYGIRTLNDYSRQTSVGVADTLSILDKRVQLTLGVRRQSVLDDGYDVTGTTIASAYDVSAWSPAYALIVKPFENVSLYANYIEGLTEGLIVPAGYANEGIVFPAYRSKQYEAGIKIDWGKLTTTASLFQITQPAFETVGDPALPTLALNGNNRNRGLELNAFGEVTDEVRVLGGITFYESDLLGTAGGTENGNRFAGIPKAELNLGTEWDTPFIPGFTLTGRVIHTGSSFADNANTLNLPSWTRFDLGARYLLISPWNSKPLTIRFSAENLFGANYWQSNGDSSIFLSAPRTFLLSTTFNF